MRESRKEERKQFTSIGQLYLAGELLDFISYDISATGILVEILPGMFLESMEDFEKLLRETCIAAFFIKDLMFTGEAEVVRVSKQNESIMLGLEFREVIYNAERLWYPRRYYRKHKVVPGVMIINDDCQVAFESVDISVAGLMLQIIDSKQESIGRSTQASGVSQVVSHLTVGQIVKIMMKELNFKAIAEIVWIDGKSKAKMGLKFLQKGDTLVNVGNLE